MLFAARHFDRELLELAITDVLYPQKPVEDVICGALTRIRDSKTAAVILGPNLPRIS